jgi:hypothetical protein
MSSQPEEVLNHAVRRKEPLGLSRCLEPPHLALSLPGRLMRDLSTVVRVLPGVMDHGWQDLPVCRRVAPQLVCYQTPRRAPLPFQELPEEPFGRTGIAIPLNQDVDHISILIHSPPEVLALPLDGHEELVQVPDVPHPPLLTLEFPGVVRAKLLTPLPDGFVGNHHSSLSEKFLDVPKAQRETMVQPYGVTDDFRREPESVVAASVGFHQPSLPGTSLS